MGGGASAHRPGSSDDASLDRQRSQQPGCCGGGGGRRRDNRDSGSALGSGAGRGGRLARRGGNFASSGDPNRARQKLAANGKKRGGPSGDDRPVSLSSVLHAAGDIRAKYVAGRVLGQGSFGVVRACKDKETGAPFAVKIIDKARVEKSGAEAAERALASLRNEMVIMQVGKPAPLATFF